MLVKELSLLAGVAGVSAFVPGPFGGFGQKPLSHDGVLSEFKCDLPPALNPAGDGLPSADELFSSDRALAKQIERHQAIVRVPSVCFDDLGGFDEDEHWAPFYDLHDALAKTYPVIHKRMKLEKINTFGLVYTLEGSDPSLKPVLLAAHQDVVPVADPSTWTYPPFDAVYDGEWLWGRGSSDDKNSMTALMSAVETILSEDDWTPTRTLILAFGFDEECSGYRGAGSISKHLTGRYGNDSIAIILDEGGLGMPELGDTLYAPPAVMEKGAFNVWLELHVQGGHSSIPFPHTGIGIISEMVSALEANPYEAKVERDSLVYNHMVCQARYSPDAQPRVTELLRKDDLEGLAAELSGQSLAVNFMIQTSQAVDMISGGQKINAMPEVVSVGVNYRVAPQDSITQVQHNVVKYVDAVATKYNLSIKAYEGDHDYEAYVAQLDSGDKVTPLYDVDYKGTLVLKTSEKSQVAPVSPTSGPVWDVFSGTIQHTFASEHRTVVPVGELMTGNTDTRHYLNLSPHVYRWSPVIESGSANIHTIDERVNMDAHMDMVKFYYNFVRNFDAADL